MIRKEKKISPEELVELGKFNFLASKPDKAMESFKRALELSPGNPDIYYNIGIVYESINNLVEAKKCFERVLKINPNHKLSKQHLEKIIGA
jgi:tetratricopeptide (TPR) repeat protein